MSAGQPTYDELAYRKSASALRHILSALVSSTTWPASSPFAKEHFGRGTAESLAEGKATVVRLVFRARGIPVRAEQRAG